MKSLNPLEFEKLRRLGFFATRKIIKVGDSYAITLPRMLVESEIHFTRVGDNYYCILEVQEDQIIIRPIAAEDIERIERLA